MTLPITGPFRRTETTFAPVPTGGRVKVGEQSRTGYRQRRPYNLPLAYSFFDIRSIGVFDTRTPGSRASVGQVHSLLWYKNRDPIVASAIGDANNLATSRLASLLRGGFEDGIEDSGIGINLSQRREAISMMTDRLKSLYDFSRKLRTFDLGGAAKALGRVPRDFKKAKVRNGLKYFGNNWLEYHFGWEPLVKDIYNAIDIIQKDITPDHISASGKSKRSDTKTTSTTYDRQTTVRKLSVKVKGGATIQVTNPNLHLANRLGLVNPLAVAWDLVPFSFIVDWFVTTNDVLSNVSEYYGLTVSSSWTSVGVKSEVAYDDDVFRDKYHQSINGTAFWFDRTLGLPAPILKVKPLKQLSVSRGLTAASLLAQFLKDS